MGTRDIEAKGKREECSSDCRSITSSPSSWKPGVAERDSRCPRPAIGDRMGVDIGPKTIELYAAMITDAQTVVWNGPMGVFEIPGVRDRHERDRARRGRCERDDDRRRRRFDRGNQPGGIADRITHISTGGGASLEFLGGRKLPGVEALTTRRVGRARSQG